MIQSYLTQTEVIKGEPALDDYLREDQVDFSDISNEVYEDMIQDFIDRQFEVRKLCVPLSLQSSVTKTAAFTGAISDQDYAQRSKLVIKSTAQTGTAIFTLQGTNDNGSNYYDIDTFTITEKGTHAFKIDTLYKKYRLKLISIGTTITYSAELIETIYENMHRDLTRARIFETLISNGEDSFQGDYERYMNRYMQRLETGRFYYDETDDEEISETESEDNYNDVVFSP